MSLIAGCASRLFEGITPSGLLEDSVITSVATELPPVDSLLPLTELPDPRLPGALTILQLSLADALQTALENSDVVRVIPGVRPFPRSGFVQARAVGTVYEPLIAESLFDASWGDFEPLLRGSMFWEREERPPNRLQNFDPVTRSVDRAAYRSEIVQPLVTGGDFGVALDTRYRFLPNPTNRRAFNPEYRPELNFQLRQPLLRGAGSKVNLAPIKIAAAQSEQSAWQFNEAIQALLRSVEATYWELYSARARLKTLETTLPLLEEAVRVSEARVRAGTAIPAEAAEARTQLMQFRNRREAALAEGREKEALLANLLGQPPDSYTRIELVDKPLNHQVPIDWNGTLATAINQRPDIMRQRLAVYVRQQELVVARNGRLPAVNAEGLWRINGLGSDLYDALDVLGDNRFNDWVLGVSVELPLINYRARGQYWAAEMALQRERALLDQTTHSATHLLASIVRDTDSYYRQYLVALEQKNAAQEWLKGGAALYRNPPMGLSQTVALDQYLRAIRSLATAETQIAEYLTRYNMALARLREAEGTLLSYWNIELQTDPCTVVHNLVSARHDQDVDNRISARQFYESTATFLNSPPKSDFGQTPLPVSPNPPSFGTRPSILQAGASDVSENRSLRLLRPETEKRYVDRPLTPTSWGHSGTRSPR